MEDLLKYVEENLNEKKEYPAFRAGDTVTVAYKIKEGNKERIQSFQGIVIQRSGHKTNETFTVRKISNSFIAPSLPINFSRSSILFSSYLALSINNSFKSASISFH